MITRLIWTIWTPMSSVPQKADKLSLSLSLSRSFNENVAHIRLWITIWWNLFATHRLPLDATKYDWSGYLTLNIAPFNSLQAPYEMLKLTKRSSNSSEQLCTSHRPGCKNRNLTCTMFGSCQGDNTWYNDHTILSTAIGWWGAWLETKHCPAFSNLVAMSYRKM